MEAQTYLNQYFITDKQLCSKLNIKKIELERSMLAGITPSWSYNVSGNFVYTPGFDVVEAKGCVNGYYFSPAVVDWYVVNNAALKTARKRFINDRHLLEHHFRLGFETHAKTNLHYLNSLNILQLNADALLQIRNASNQAWFNHVSGFFGSKLRKPTTFTAIISYLTLLKHFQNLSVDAESHLNDELHNKALSYLSHKLSVIELPPSPFFTHCSVFDSKIQAITQTLPSQLVQKYR